MHGGAGGGRQLAAAAPAIVAPVARERDGSHRIFPGVVALTFTACAAMSNSVWTFL